MRSIREIFKVGFGPSSSHTIGPGRAARIYARRNPHATAFRLTLFGSLASTGKGHGTDEAVKKELAPHNVEIVWMPEKNLPPHPNGMRFEVVTPQTPGVPAWTVFSTGGGDLEDAHGPVEVSKDIYPLATMDGILDWCRLRGAHLWEYVLEHEDQDFPDFLEDIRTHMTESVLAGLCHEGSLPGPLQLPRKAAAYFTRAQSSTGDLKSKGTVFSYALAVAEENAGGGRVVTAPTCGASGVVPAVLTFVHESRRTPRDRILRALAIAGLIANLVKTNGSISGAEVGCQGEIGTACAMAAGAMTYLLGGSPRQVEYAAEMGFEHYLGLTCDPVESYVQIPCIERNAFAADTARESAVFAYFSDGTHHISFDQVLRVMMETGCALQAEYRETGRGGLARQWKPLV
ncbi:MAG: L-serine ammonia-lyase, iron-sulfur-dependent, subunit alpha [Candidatus Aminicenantes bacterium]|nr:L-serine ammonia-lyase, iron-sulfur-dependent, subunit alpha [Candidatus Aminicenantes bacterium]